MSGHIRYTPQSGHSHRAAQSAARSDNRPIRHPTPEPPVPAPPTPSTPSTPTPTPSTLPPSPLPRQRNVEAVLTLGATRYMMVRELGTFCCPPVPFQLGQRGMDIYINMMHAARTVVATGKNEAKVEYYRYMREMAVLLHSHMRPVGIVARNLWRLRLTRNPFLKCSEQEVKEAADFFLQGRMKSSVQSILEPGEVSA